MNEQLQSELTLFLELKCYLEEGVPLFLCGRPASISEVVDQQVREEGTYSYMADFVRNEKGKLLQIRYDRVVNN